MPMGKNNQNNIFLIGHMGAGKTSVGKQIAKELQRDFYDSDEVIEKRTGADIPWIFDIEGESGFRKRELKVIAELTKLKDIVLATGGGVIATQENCNALAANGIVVYLKISLADQMQRTSKSKKRPLSKEETLRRETLQKLQLEHSPIYEELADLVYESNLKAVRSVALDVIKKLRKENYI